MKRETEVLFLTVGTGNAEDLEKSLFAPIRKSIADGEWHRVILLPSHASAGLAKQVKERARDVAVEIRPLPAAGDENDAGACFDHFDKVIGDLIDKERVQPGRIVVDFTRGTKAMSAALVLAATRRDVSILRYVHGERDVRGMVVPGTEKWSELHPTTLITGRRRLDLAYDLMRHGDFGAVVAILSDAAWKWPPKLRDEATGLSEIAQVYAAWDRLDYCAAVEDLKRLKDSSYSVERFQPSDDVRDWLERLASEPDPCWRESPPTKHDRSDIEDGMKAYADWLRAVACDLLANAERRVRDWHFEDALIRAYRILELIGQIRLFDRGYDSSCLDPDDSTVKQCREKLKKKNQDDFSPPRNGKLSAARFQAACLLSCLGDEFGKKLRKLDNDKDMASAKGRNNSVLIHGFTAKAPGADGLEKMLSRLEALLTEDDQETSQRLERARRLYFRAA